MVFLNNGLRHETRTTLGKKRQIYGRQEDTVTTSVKGEGEGEGVEEEEEGDFDDDDDDELDTIGDGSHTPMMVAMIGKYTDSVPGFVAIMAIQKLMRNIERVNCKKRTTCADVTDAKHPGVDGGVVVV